jgi:regulator of sirC expression with transglutaminase-like and TPR domain
MIKKTLFSLTIFSQACFASISPAYLYNTLEETSLQKHIAFYLLYKETPEGEKALRHIQKLLHIDDIEKLIPLLEVENHFAAFLNTISSSPHTTAQHYDEGTLVLIESLSQKKGVTTSQRLMKAILDDTPENALRCREYEASLDIMTLHIRAKLPQHPKPYEYITALNEFIYSDMGFHFPPTTLYSASIDAYSFLPSVLDRRQGVCLGLSAMYVCLAERLGLTLEAVTLPGHIFIRYRDDDTTINIETTARGIHIPTERYLSLTTKKVRQHHPHELTSLTLFNMGTTSFQQKKYAEAVAYYRKALKHLPADTLTLQYLAYALIGVGEEKEALKILSSIKDSISPYGITTMTSPEDFLEGKASFECITTAHMQVDETQESLQNKKKALEDILEKHPRFREGIFQLAVTFLQLQQPREGYEALKRYHAIDETNPTVEYYLAALSSERYAYKEAWSYLENVERILKKHEHSSELLKRLHYELSLASPKNILSLL